MVIGYGLLVIEGDSGLWWRMVLGAPERPNKKKMREPCYVYSLSLSYSYFEYFCRVENQFVICDLDYNK